MEKFLQRGNIIRLEKNMSVFIMAKEKFVRKEYAFSEKLIWTCIDIGCVLTSEVNSLERAYLVSKLENFFRDNKVSLDSDEIKEFINSNFPNNVETFDTNIYKGKYIVTDAKTFTSTTGKSGWRIDATKLENNKYSDDGLKVYFYQTPGCIATILPSEICIVDDILNILS